MPEAVSGASSSRRTNAEPTITPSAYPATSAAWSPLRDAEPDADRQVGELPGPLHQRAGAVAGALPGPGDAHDGGRVDEAAAGLHGHRQPRVGGGRRDQEDPVEVVRVGRRQPLGGLVGDEVRGDQSRAAGGGEVGGEPLDAVPLDRVPVGHDDHRRAGLRDRLDGAQHVGGAHAARRAPLRGGLDRPARPSPGRSTAGRPRSRHSRRRPWRASRRPPVHVGEPGRQVADQRGAALGPALLEGGRTLMPAAPRCSRRPSGSRSRRDRSTRRRCVTSLSPRPERLTRIVDARRLACAERQRAGERVRALDRRDDPLGAAEQRERLHRLGVGDRPVLRAAGLVRARRAPARRPGSPGRPRSSATRSSGRPRPAARRCGCRAARRRSPPVMVAACRPVSTPSPPASKP